MRHNWPMAIKAQHKALTKMGNKLKEGTAYADTCTHKRIEKLYPPPTYVADELCT